MSRKILRYFIIVSGSLILGLAALAGIILLNEGKIRQYAIEQINTHLEAKVMVEEIDLTLFKQFPYVSLDLKKVHIEDPLYEKRTLLHAEHVFISFKLFDILQQTYRIKQILIDSGSCNIRFNKKGEGNYNILRLKEGDSGNGFLQLKQIKVSRLFFSYADEANLQHYMALIHVADLSFQRSKSLDELSCETDLEILHMKSGRMNLVKNKSVKANIIMSVEEDQKLLAIKKAELLFEELALTTKGSITYGQKPQFNLLLDASQTTIQGILSLLPVSLPETLSKYKSNGNISLSASIIGDIHKPNIHIGFDIENGNLSEPKTGVSLQRISCKGQYSNGKKKDLSTSLIDISSFSFQLEQGFVKGSLKIENLNKPYITLIADGSLPLAPLLRFQQNKKILKANGTLETSLTIKGPLDDLTRTNGLEAISSGHLRLTANDIVIAGRQQTIPNLRANIEMSGNLLLIRECYLETAKTDISIHGEVKNIFGYLFKNQLLEASLNYESQNLDVGNMLFYTPGEKGGDSTDIKLPAQIAVHVLFKIGSLRYQLFEAKNITGELDWKQRLLIIRSFKCHTMQGEMELHAEIDNARNGKFLISANAQMNNIGIRELFRQCADFGQHEITHQHINGTLKGVVEMVSVWDEKLNCETENLFVNSNIQIKNGELNNYKPLESLSRFAKIEDLKNLKFAELNNKIQISKRTIYVPEMEARNNALNLVLAGKHTFDNMIEYRMKIRIKELLAKKWKTQQPNEFGEEDETGKGLYLYLNMAGPVSNPKISYDKVATLTKIHQDIQTEKQSIKDVLKHSLGIGKDTSIKEKKNQSEELEFEKE